MSGNHQYREISDKITNLSAKERERLQQEKERYLTEINRRLDQLEDSPFKIDLAALRNQYFLKFPTDPTNLTIWTVAYYEDWLREFAKVPPDYFAASK